MEEKPNLYKSGDREENLLTRKTRTNKQKKRKKEVDSHFIS